MLYIHIRHITKMGEIFSKKHPSFCFKGDLRFEIFTNCDICHVQRFTNSQIRHLSDPQLTKEKFMTHFSNFSKCHKFLCQECEKQKTSLGHDSNSNDNDFDLDLEKMFDIGSIPQDSFLFKGNKFYPLYTHCQICGKQRFTNEEIKELSDPALTKEIFMEKYKQFSYEQKSICHNRRCEERLYLIGGGYNVYLLNSTPFLYGCHKPATSS